MAPDRHPDSRTPTTWSHISTTFWWPVPCMPCLQVSTIGAPKVDGRHVLTETRGKIHFWWSSDLLQCDLLPHALPRAWQVCRVVTLTIRCSLPISTCRCFHRWELLAFGIRAGVFLPVLCRIALHDGQGRKSSTESLGKPLKGWSGKCHPLRHSIPLKRRPSSMHYGDPRDWLIANLGANDHER